ncbi:MAG: DNA mismatch repair endonuclease MutL [Fibrobacteraceae bacterium]
MDKARIHCLPEDVINKIAAGEVIERPASVVKELVENAMDAGATCIDIQIEEGGKKKIRISDNGCGMGEEDLNLCYLRHTTSKLTSADDLFHLRTNGFRGEAVASIAAVSHLTITTRTEADSEARWIKLSGGTADGKGKGSRAKGTEFLVENLFFNTPVRKNFLGSDALEGSRILDIVTRLALAHPEIRFDYKVNGRDVFTGVAGNDLRSRIAEAIGTGIAKTMLPVDYTEAGIHVTGFTTPVNEGKGKRNHLFFYLQKRPIWNPTAAKAVQRAYEAYGTQDAPVSVLFLEMPDMAYDVNVHPAKREVRFANESEVYLAIHHAVRETLQNESAGESPMIRLEDFVAAKTAVNSIELNSTEQRAPQTDSAHDSQGITYSTKSASSEKENFSQNTAPRKVTNTEPDDTVQDLFSLPEFGKVIALNAKSFETPAKIETFAAPQFLQIAKTYFVCEDSKGLLIIDQCAAHQRILFERALRAIESGSGIDTQELLFPELIELSKMEIALLKTVTDDLDQLGFHLEPFGNDTYQLRGIPRELSISRAVSAIRELIESLENENFEANPVKETIAKAWAKSNAYQAGVVLSQDDMAQLMAQLISTKDPMTSPSGRPTLMRLPLEDIDRKFKR